MWPFKKRYAVKANGVTSMVTLKELISSYQMKQASNEKFIAAKKILERAQFIEYQAATTSKGTLNALITEIAKQTKEQVEAFKIKNTTFVECIQRQFALIEELCKEDSIKEWLYSVQLGGVHPEEDKYLRILLVAFRHLGLIK